MYPLCFASAWNILLNIFVVLSRVDKSTSNISAICCKRSTFKTVNPCSILTYAGGDTITNDGIFQDRKVTEINMQYLKSQSFDNMLFYRLGAERKEENLYTATLHKDQFLIPYFDNTDFALPVKYPSFGSFYSKEKDMNYEKYIDQYLKIIERYPDSRFLTAQIAMNLQSYKIKEDLRKLYNVFSEIGRQTSWGKIIYDYIENHYTFPNTILPAWDSGELEPVVQDSIKFNLIIFVF